MAGATAMGWVPAPAFALGRSKIPKTSVCHTGATWAPPKHRHLPHRSDQALQRYTVLGGSIPGIVKSPFICEKSACASKSLKKNTQ